MDDLTFHRGASSWVAGFQYNNFDYLGFYDRDKGCWQIAKDHQIDPLTRSEIEVELTEKLKEWLKETGVLPKSEV